jgi:uncharacterized protein YndB with AHSA1/START domain
MKTIQSDAFFAESLDKVWQALTDPQEAADWLVAGDFRAERGHRFEWKDARSRGAPASPLDGADCRVEEVVDAEDEKLISFKFTLAPGSLVSFVTWRLAPQGEGTRFVVEQEFLGESELKPHPTVVSLALYRRNRAMIEVRSYWVELLARLARLSHERIAA